MSTTTTTTTEGRTARWILILTVAGIALFASYRFASAQNAGSKSAQARAGAAGLTQTAAAPGEPGAASDAAACACCGGAQPPAGAETAKAATVEGGVQKISVDLSKGYYDPTQIELKAGVPAEITFGQGSGCMAQVQSKELGFFEDLTGGPKTIKLPALKAGSYTFSCGMEMVFGAIVVK